MSGSSGAIIGGPNLRLIDSITQFVNGTQAVWDDISVPIPNGLVVYAIDTTAIKIGDGVTLYANLPVRLALNSSSHSPIRWLRFRLAEPVVEGSRCLK